VARAAPLARGLGLELAQRLGRERTPAEALAHVLRAQREPALQRSAGGRRAASSPRRHSQELRAALEARIPAAPDL
jgi:hypothetical protein